MSERLDAFYQRMLSRPQTATPVRRLLKTVAVVVRELSRDQVHVRAATLAYWSLVAIVPALLLAAAVTQPLGPEVGRPIRELLFNAMLAGAVADVGATLDVWLAEVDVARLGAVGLLGVAFTASRIYFSVEEAYNLLWNVRMRRGLVLRLVIFYATLTLAPVLLAAGFAFTGQIQETFGINALRLALPVLLTTTTFVGAIRTLPDTDVRWGPALLGGLTSAILFEIVKLGFNAYVNVLGAGNAAAAVYGSLGLFPVFLLWLYVLWVIVLLGVELAYVAQRYDELMTAEDQRLLGERHSRRHADALFAVQCLLVVAGRYIRGEGPTTESEVTRTLQSEPAFVRNALETLEDAGVLAESATGYLMSVPPETLRLRDVLIRYRTLTRPSIAEDALGNAIITELLATPGSTMDISIATAARGER